MSTTVLLSKLPGLDPLNSGEVLVAQNIVFAVIGLIMIIAALRMVTTTNVVHAALFLVIVLAGVAGLFILLGSEFVAVTQILVYIGAIVVLFLFGIMLTRGSYGTDEDTGRERHLMAVLVGLLMLGVISASLIETFGDAELSRSTPSSTAEIGDSIFSQYIIPFEAISVLLLAALIGAVVVARKD